ncbi:MAG: nucleotide-binding protein [Anaerolineales bacterium]|nr:nucleotide-binding protein [Anaerolineales bacterium]
MKSYQRSSKSRIFVIHGRNEEMRRALFDFLRAIDLKPIEWNEAVALTGKPSPFMGEILDAAMQYAQAIIVLFTGDDQARLRDEFLSGNDPDYETETTPQSRPNVIFEAGMALGKYPKRTILVQVGTLRPFSDIAGRHFIRLRNSSKSRQELAQRLKLAGCEVDLSGTDWHDAGLFPMK